ncbi:hypothetical protein Tco_0105268 [Tanacetum coccineum]
MEMKHDIENMMMEEYLEYESEKENQLWRSVRSMGAPTRYEGSYFDSFYHNRNEALEYPDSDEKIDVDKYYKLPLLDLCFQTPQPFTKYGFVSPNERVKVNIDSMTMEVYGLYTTKQCRKTTKNHRGIKQEEVQNGCDHKVFWYIDQKDENVDVNTAREKEEVQLYLNQNPVVQPYVPPISFPNELKIVRQEEPGKKTLKKMEVKSLQIKEAIPHVSKVMDDMMQPLTLQATHITPLDDAYVASATNLVLVELSKEFDDELLSISLTDEEVECLMRDVEELEKLLVHDLFSSPKELREHLETEVVIHAGKDERRQGVFPGNRHETTTRPLGMPRGSKACCIR